MKTYKFYDTCSLLLKVDNLFEETDPIVISSITLNELENIKTATNKDPDVKYAARRLLHMLSEHPEAYEIHIFKMDMLEPIINCGLAVTEDAKILATAIDYDRTRHPDETVFVTNDLALYHIANLFFGSDSIKRVNEEENDDYDGYLEVTLDDNGMAELYSNPDKNIYNLHINQYLVVYNTDGEQVDAMCWTGEGYRHLNYKSFNSRMFGEIKPFKGDIYQAMAADSLLNNTITMLKGPAGSGKTFLSLAYLFAQLERGKIDRIIVFCNTVATKNSAKLGYYPGTRDEKLLDSQIGNLLSSKCGGRIIVEQLIQQEQLVLLPLSDIRGYDTSGMRAGIYISEAQNMDVSLMKLTLQRIGEDGICIIDGDCKAQVDNVEFAGANNGMRRASKIFRGEDIYGEITLKKIHRSRIAQVAEQL